MWMHGTLLEVRQRELWVQKLRLSPKFESKYGDAQIEVAVSVLVYRNALIDKYKEEFFGAGTATSAGS